MDEPEPPPAGPDLAYPYNVYQGHRLDYDTIVGLVEERSRVLDIGCGDGELLCRLIAAKNVDATGIELAQDSLVHCVRRGISVIQADADKGLAAFPEQSYDYVVLSMTLQVVKRPDIVIREMLRVGKKCIVSFPNFGYWKVRAKLLLSGRAPITRSLPYTWDISPNRHFLSIKDFRGFCRAHNARIEKEIALSCRGQSVFLANLLADEAVFVLSAQNRL